MKTFRIKWNERFALYNNICLNTFTTLYLVWNWNLDISCINMFLLWFQILRYDDRKLAIRNTLICFLSGNFVFLIFYLNSFCRCGYGKHKKTVFMWGKSSRLLVTKPSRLTNSFINMKKKIVIGSKLILEINAIYNSYKSWNLFIKFITN